MQMLSQAHPQQPSLTKPIYTESCLAQLEVRTLHSQKSQPPTLIGTVAATLPHIDSCQKFNAIVIGAYLVMQESVVLSNSRILSDKTILPSNVVLSSFFKKMGFFNVKCHFVYVMKIHKYERTLVLKNNNSCSISKGFLTCIDHI